MKPYLYLVTRTTTACEESMPHFSLRPWTITKCQCGDPICNQYRLSNQHSVGFNHDDAVLMAAAPDLLEACKAQHQAIDMLFALLILKDKEFMPTESGMPWSAVIKGNEAIKKATQS